MIYSLSIALTIAFRHVLHLVWVLVRSVVDGNRSNYSIVSKKRHRIELLILRNSRDTEYLLLEITVRIGNKDKMPRDARSVRISISASSLLLRPSIIVQNGFRFDISNTVRLRNLSSKFRVVIANEGRADWILRGQP